MLTEESNVRKQPLVIIAGPTATGKSALSVEIAKAVGVEIISADSIQVYKYMDIGSAKITLKEMQGIPHYLVDEIDPTVEYNVMEFAKRAKAYVGRIADNHHLPIVCGGTGFYIQALLYDVEFTEEEDDGQIRKELESLLLKPNGEEILFNRLREADPEYADMIPKQNHKRIIRALEYYSLTGKPFSQHNAEQRIRPSAYDALFYVLTDDRSKMYDRIDRRVDNMIRQGLVEEVKGLLDRGYSEDLVSMQGLGYKEIVSYLHGEYTLEEAVDIIKRDTRHFAKRQLTWFRREKEVIWLDISQCSHENIVSRILEDIDNRFGRK